MVDRYTKAVLTVIAAALVALVTQGAIRESRAQLGIQKVQICGDNAADCASIIQFGRYKALVISPF